MITLRTKANTTSKFHLVILSVYILKPSARTHPDGKSARSVPTLHFLIMMILSMLCHCLLRVESHHYVIRTFNVEYVPAKLDLNKKGKNCYVSPSITSDTSDVAVDRMHVQTALYDVARYAHCFLYICSY